MAKNIKRHITHIKSNVVENNKPKLPQADDINFGEIAVNYADGYETISIKTVKPDNTPSITPFSSDEYYTKQKLGNDFMGVNSGRTVTDALSAMDNKKTDVSAFTEHTASTVHMDPTEKTNLDSLATNIATISGITSQMVSNWNTASANTHTHDNKTLLDNIIQNDVNHWNDAYSKEHTHSNKNVLDGVSEPKVSNWDTAYNNSHTHSNKAVLDNIDQTDVDHWDEGYGQRHTHSNKAVLDNIDQTDVNHWDDAYGKEHTHSNKAVLDNIDPDDIDHWNDAYNQRHTHSNKATLDNITAAYTTAEQTKLSGIADGAQVNVIETVKVNGTALTPDSRKAVNVPVPTTTNELTNNSNFVSDASYVHTDNNYSTTEKNKLSNIEAYAEANQNAFSNIKVGSTTVVADSQTDTVTLIGGGIVTIEANDGNDSITISASNAVTSVAGHTGDVTLDKYDVGLNNVDNTADANKKVASAATAAVAESVDWANVGGKPGSFTPSAHNHASNEVTAMTGYAKASAEAAISASDTLNVAIGKLEKSLDGKQPTGNYAYKSDLDNLFDDAKYEMSGQTHVINFYHNNVVKATIDATDFIVDGMVDNVVISGGNLVITFNTDSGKQPITIPLTNIFNPDNYYQKDKFTDSVSVKFNRSGAGSSETISAEVKNISAATFDSTSKTVGTKFSEIDSALGGKVNTSDVVTAITSQTSASTNPIATSVVASIAEAITDLNDDKQDKLVSGTNIKTINGDSILGSGNIVIQGGSSYSAGTGINISSSNVISVSLPISAGTGTNSIIEGIVTTASGSYSHAEGNYTIASGSCSHTEGTVTAASGRASHAEGIATHAYGEGSHSEGANTTADGDDSHAEGASTTASGEYSHAEGNSTTANGESSHAEGRSTIANNTSEHACGQYNVSSSASTTFGDGGNTLFSVGNGTADDARHNAFEIRQNGDIYIVKNGLDVKLQDQLGGGGGASVVELTNYSSHSEAPLANVYTIGGLPTESKTKKEDSMIDTIVFHRTDGGNNYSYYTGHYVSSLELGTVYYISNIYSEVNVPSDIKALFEHPVTAGTGTNSVIEGSGTTASGNYSHAEGSDTTASGPRSHAEGGNTTASGEASHAEGDGTTASTSYCHAEGSDAAANGNASHAEGTQTTANGDSSHAEGYTTTADGDYSHAEGDSTTASTECSHAEGSETTASGYASHAEGSSTKANGESSHAEGNLTTASGRCSHAEGNQTKANGESSHAEGVYTIANNASEHACGQYNVSSSASTTFGNSGNTLFSVGNGTASNARHNAFEIRQNGTLIISIGNTTLTLDETKLNKLIQLLN